MSETPLLDYQRVDVSLEGKPKLLKRGDPAAPMTALERIIGRELDAETLDALDLMDNGKKSNMDLLLEVGQGAGRTFVDATYPESQGSTSRNGRQGRTVGAICVSLTRF